MVNHIEIVGPFGGPFEVEVTNLPTITLSGTFDLGLDDIHVKEIDKIKVGIDPITATVNAGLDNIRIKELPTIRLALEPVRCHVPVDFSVCFNLFGHELGSIRLCGESQFIAEPYVPNPCECAPVKGSHGND